jgi:thioredoxin reductase (NADPH)
MMDDHASHYDIGIIGQGPAGLSAAIYAVRAGLTVVLVGRDNGSLGRAHDIENYFGFVEPISGIELLERGIAQARRLGVSLIRGEVTGVRFDNEYEIQTTAGDFRTASLILATGMPRRKASVAGLSEFEGRGVSYCSLCDGFFYRSKNIAVIGNGAFAFKEAEELGHIARSVTIFTNGRPVQMPEAAGGEAPAAEAVPARISVDTRRILRVEGDEFRVQSMIVANEPAAGQEIEQAIPIDGIFVAEGTASALDLALMLGVENDGKAITVDCGQQTNLPGIFAIGDCTGGVMQVAVAVGEGAKAGIAAMNYVRGLKRAAAGG